MSDHTSKGIEEKEAGLTAPQSQVQGEVRPLPPGVDADVAATFLANLDPAIINEPISAADARKVLWKIDLIILPLVTLSVIISAVDKVIISNAAIYGMRTDAHLVGNEYSWVASIFYFGYLLFEWPANLLIQRLPLRTFYAATVFGWAVLTFCTAASNSFGSLAAVRFLMGGFEAVVFPTCTIVSAMWWTRKEQPIRVAVWFNTLSSVVTGLLSYGIGHANSSVAPWRLLFITLGSITVVWSVVLYIFLPSSPVEAWYLTDREKYICIERVRDNNTGIEDKTIKWYQVKECLMDPKPWLIAIFACSQNIPNGGLVTFASIIVSGLGFSSLNTTLLGVPTGVIATCWQLILAVLSSKLQGWRCFIIAVSQAFPIISAVLMWQLQGRSKLSLLGAYYGFYSYWAPYVLCTSLPLANTSGHTKKITANTMFFVGYCVGNILGPQVFRASDAPRYTHGYIGLLACFIVSAVSISLYGILCRQENRRRDKIQKTTLETAHAAITEAEAFSDLTDKEKPEFRYDY